MRARLCSLYCSIASGNCRTPAGIKMAYPSPGVAGAGAFTAAVELREQRSLVVSFLYHMAVQRLCHNPLEDKSVVGIANYLDIGLQVILATAACEWLLACRLVAAGVGLCGEHCLAGDRMIRDPLNVQQGQAC